MPDKTPLYERHVEAGARTVDFGGWDMPLHYGSQIDEHHAVRNSAGIFDVSHMTVVDIAGQGAKNYLQRLLANDVARLTTPGKGLYGCMLNESGGVVDDLIVYWRGHDAYRVVVNAATRVQDLDWMSAVATDFAVTVDERPELMMLAIQGPKAATLAEPLLPVVLRRPALEQVPFMSDADGDWFVARTGYTGEDGWEIILDADAGCSLWDAALAAGIRPCGLGARDTLRLEAGLALYGQDMDQQASPLVSALGWTVAWEPAERSFIGRAALEQQRNQGVDEKLIGLVLEDRGIMRHGQRVITEAGDGTVTSGGFSPTMQRSIALARVPADAAGVCQVQIRNDQRAARIVNQPFVRNGRVLVEYTI
jgi:aminomethyltransferase